ncbi:MAG TPA: class I SAM-dependent methyltransferase [Terracidiphilus sp.]|jgi:ubiquinone/menaquinone biosynthesis C-methylase UbiE|nr:class I SAM-dependent methyltransferase [Terracidiphilus sp.]
MEQRLPWILGGAELGSDVLEIGPGPGLTTDLLRSRAANLTAIEADPGLAERLRQRLGAKVQVVTGNATTMPFPDASFSGCATFTMLHHVPSAELQDKMLREIARVLRPGGALAGCDSLTNTVMRLIHLGDTFVPVNPDTFPARLRAAGFEEVLVETAQGYFRFHARRPQ